MEKDGVYNGKRVISTIKSRFSLSEKVLPFSAATSAWGNPGLVACPFPLYRLHSVPVNEQPLRRAGLNAAVSREFTNFLGHPLGIKANVFAVTRTFPSHVNFQKSRMSNLSWITYLTIAEICTKFLNVFARMLCPSMEEGNWNTLLEHLTWTKTQNILETVSQLLTQSKNVDVLAQ